MDYRTHWISVLRDRCAAKGQEVLYRFLVDGESKEQTLTYGQLELRARAVGARLQAGKARGERVLLLYPPGLELIAGLMGCMYAGAIAVACRPPQSARQSEAAARVRGIVRDARPIMAMGEQSQLQTLRQICPETMPAGLNLDDLEEGWAGQWRDPGISCEDIACLQYTSGTTSEPKGVMLSHGNLLHNAGMIQEAFGHTADSRGVIWLPPYHDMGLMGGILQPLYAGFPVTLMPPTAFLQRPARWLEAISRFGATTSGGPNFAYELCVDSMSEEAMEGLDLSRWRVAFNGAEAVRAGTLERFSRKFEQCGFRRSAFRPCYGLAEATLMVSCALGKDPASGMPYKNEPRVGCGRICGGSRVLIVDPKSRTPCEEGAVGEIWIDSPSVAKGYWQRPRETAAVFDGRLPASDDLGGFLRSGDLGYLRGGELFIAGRLKDLIVLRGMNHHPEDIERMAEQAHPALRAGGGAAFAVETDQGEGLVIAHELKRSQRNTAGEEIFAAIRRAIGEGCGIETHAIVLLKPGRLPMTPSGKCRRGECRRLFVTGGWEAIGQWTRQPSARSPSANGRMMVESIGQWLKAKVAEVVGVSEVEIASDRPLAMYGIGSADAVGLAGQLSQALGRDLPATLMWDYPSIDELVDYLTHAQIA